MDVFSDITYFVADQTSQKSSKLQQPQKTRGQLNALILRHMTYSAETIMSSQNYSYINITLGSIRVTWHFVSSIKNIRILSIDI